MIRNEKCLASQIKLQNVNFNKIYFQIFIIVICACFKLNQSQTQHFEKTSNQSEILNNFLDIKVFEGTSDVVQEIRAPSSPVSSYHGFTPARTLRRKSYFKINTTDTSKPNKTLFNPFRTCNKELKSIEHFRESNNTRDLEQLNITARLFKPLNNNRQPLATRVLEVGLGDIPHHVFIFRPYDVKKDLYRAFCAGSIIGEKKVITSASCFVTNRKAYRHNYKSLFVVAGNIQIFIKRNQTGASVQWRKIVKIYSQRFLRFPAYNLGLLILDEPFTFNSFVNKIPYESTYHDFDGVCIAAAVKTTKSWSIIKSVFTEEVEMIKRKTCERILQRSCRNYFCTSDVLNDNKYAYSESRGGGLICRETGDPQEVDTNQGILVGVTSVVNAGLPNLYMRIGPHFKWVTDFTCKLTEDKFILFSVICFWNIWYVIFNH